MLNTVYRLVAPRRFEVESACWTSCGKADTFVNLPCRSALLPGTPPGGGHEEQASDGFDPRRDWRSGL